jgi:hypothetical protein
LTGAGLVAGCGKHSTPPPSPAATQNPAPVAETNLEETSFNPTDPAPAVPAESTEGTPKAEPSSPPNLGQLTLDLHHWVAKHQRKPHDFEEFAAEYASRIPPVPAGKKYSINSELKVVLVNR